MGCRRRIRHAARQVHRAVHRRHLQGRQTPVVDAELIDRHAVEPGRGRPQIAYAQVACRNRIGRLPGGGIDGEQDALLEVVHLDFGSHTLTIQV